MIPICKLLLLITEHEVVIWTKDKDEHQINTKLYFFQYKEVLQPWNKQQNLEFNKIGEMSKGHEL